MIKNIIIFFILLSSASFFRIIFFPERMISLAEFGVPAIMFAVILVQEIYGKERMMKLNFKQPIFLIFAGVFLSMIIANAYHNQNYALTFWAQRFMYFYIFYFFLHMLKPDVKELEKIVLALGMLYAASFLIQYIIYPTTLFDVRQDVDRGTIRIFIPGSSFMALSLYLCLNRFYTLNKIKYVFPVVIFLSIMILTGTRYALSVTFLVIIASLIFSKVIRSRYLIYMLVIIATVPLFFIFEEIFEGMIGVSHEQSEDFMDNVRIRASRFFLTDFFPNPLAYFFGNGQDHMGSSYGMRVFYYKSVFGYFQSDIGFLGDFSKFGLFFAVGAVWLLIKAWKAPVKPENSYVKFSLLGSTLVLPVAGVFSNPFAIAVLCIIMYILDNNINETKENSNVENQHLSGGNLPAGEGP